MRICIGLATMGFQQDSAIKMNNGIRVPLTAADIWLVFGREVA
jgi:hypothetical protein